MKIKNTVINNEDIQIINNHVVKVEYDESGFEFDDPRNNSSLHFIMDMGRGEHFESENGGVEELLDAIIAYDKEKGIEYEEDDENDPENLSVREIRDSQDYRQILEMADKRGFWLQPVYVYDHSTKHFSIFPFADRWDSCQNGIIWLAPNEIEKNPARIKEAKSILEELTALYNGWVYVVGHAPIINRYEDEDGEEILEIGDYGWLGGFIGDESVKDYIENDLPVELEAENKELEAKKNKEAVQLLLPLTEDA